MYYTHHNLRYVTRWEAEAHLHIWALKVPIVCRNRVLDCQRTAPSAILETEKHGQAKMERKWKSEQGRMGAKVRFRRGGKGD